jgi:uncharacterized protein
MPRLELAPPLLTHVREILTQAVPDLEVWAYGSRVTGGAHAASDLDLVLRDPGDPDRPTGRIGALRARFAESRLPILIDLLDWARVPASFQREIEAEHVVIQFVEPRP